MTLNGIQNEARYSRNLSILMSSRVQSNLLVFFVSLLCIISQQPLRAKSPDMKFFLVPVFSYLYWMRRCTILITIFSPNTGKYIPEKTPNSDTFRVVSCFNIKQRITIQGHFGLWPKYFSFNILRIRSR